MGDGGAGQLIPGESDIFLTIIFKEVIWDVEPIACVQVEYCKGKVDDRRKRANRVDEDV